MHGEEWSYLDRLDVKSQAFLLVGEEFLNIFALITLKLNYFAHLGVDDNGSIAGLKVLENSRCEAGESIPNFFLMTLRIFFWSNFLGRP